MEGFQVYGAVVTGPVKELLKLKENRQIQGANLGDMTYWNWTE
ncbi:MULTISPECIES: anti sigma factor C-terminal domain-containing protein [Mesobacillus]|nr:MULTISPECIES: anti sigma factor C-terminal domain-containing protein [Mesobacillus]